MTCTIPLKLHPLAESALGSWMAGRLSDFEFLRYVTLVNSDYYDFAVCLIELAH